MDGFGVKHFSKYDVYHLLDSLKNYYAISTDWGGRNYPGMTIYCNYNRGYVDISIPDYVTKLFERIQHPKPKRPQYAPHLWTVSAYGKRLQMALYLNESDMLDKKSTKRIQ